MMQRAPRDLAYRISSWISITAIFLAGVVGALLKLDVAQTAKWAPILGGQVGAIQDEAWWLIVAFTTLSGATKATCHYLGPPWAWKALQSVLDELREHAFIVNAADATHHHRVTLFKRVRYRIRIWPWRSRCWPWGKGRWPASGWLVPVLRSGHTTQRSGSVFLAPDDADRAEGVAGQAWSHSESIIYLEALPDLDEDSSTPDVKRYARETWLNEGLVRKRLKAELSCSRSFCGIAIEVKGKVWGVIVLDSRRTRGIRKPSGKNLVTYTVMAKFLRTLLERA